MIIILIILLYIDIDSIKSNYKITYYQDFISIRNWTGRNITLGFNVSENWAKYIDYKLYDSEGAEVIFF